MTDMPKKKTAAKGADLSSYRHEAATRVNNPTAEFQGLVDDKGEKLVWKRNTQLDPQLVWRGKDQEAGPLEVEAPPIYIQEKVDPRAIINDLRRRAGKRKAVESDEPLLWSDFDFKEREEPTEFYSHEFPVNWSNRMILGDSLLVMASLAEKERLRGQVQMIFIDPPYGIKFNSYWQPSTKNRNVQDGKPEHISREPEVIKAFRDTWKDGVSSYLSYLRDRRGLFRCPRFRWIGSRRPGMIAADGRFSLAPRISATVSGRSALRPVPA